VLRGAIGGGFAHHGKDTVVDTSALAVPRRGETVAVASVIVGQRVQQRCLGLIHGEPGTPD